MAEAPWREVAIEAAAGRDEIRRRAAAALAEGPLCDDCLGRLFAQVATGLANRRRGEAVRGALDFCPAAGPCRLCQGLFAGLDAWAARARQALEDLEFDTFLVASHADPAMAAREEALWRAVGGDLAEPLKQAFNRELALRLGEPGVAEPDFTHPDVVVVADHAAGTVTVEVRPLYVGGRYRKLVRGIPQCRWSRWATSVQAIIGDPVVRAAGAEDHRLHGCGREDVDVRCLAERPFALEVLRPRRRRLDWPALAREIGRDGRVEVLDLGPVSPAAPADLKALRPDKTYRATVRLAAPVEAAALARLGGLVGTILQETPARVAARRSRQVRRREVLTAAWRAANPQTLQLEVRTSAGLYVKELVSGDGGRTRPSVADLLGVAAECAELDVTAIHLAEPWPPAAALPASA
jgi:tRNA pseudouridine synthase 10